MRSKRMQPVADHAERIEQDAVQLFVQAQQELTTMEQQLQQLLEYREEYRQKLTVEQGRSMNIQRVRDFQLFISNLDQTITQAHINIESCKQVCEGKKQAWLKCRSRSQALNSVVEKYQQDERKQLERAEQKEQDEHAQRIQQKSRR